MQPLGPQRPGLTWQKVGQVWVMPSQVTLVPLACEQVGLVKLLQDSGGVNGQLVCAMQQGVLQNSLVFPVELVHFTLPHVALQRF